MHFLAQCPQKSKSQGNFENPIQMRKICEKCVPIPEICRLGTGEHKYGKGTNFFARECTQKQDSKASHRACKNSARSQKSQKNCFPFSLESFVFTKHKGFQVEVWLRALRGTVCENRVLFITEESVYALVGLYFLTQSFHSFVVFRLLGVHGRDATFQNSTTI